MSVNEVRFIHVLFPRVENIHVGKGVQQLKRPDDHSRDMVAGMCGEISFLFLLSPFGDISGSARMWYNNERIRIIRRRTTKTMGEKELQDLCW